MKGRGAVFLDRDNTLVEDPGYLHDAAAVRLLPGVRSGLVSLVEGGWPLVVVSNQAGIARGLYGPEAFHEVMRRIEEVLAADGVTLLASYFCPHHPEVTGPCDCRKPAVALFERAAREHGLDLSASWFLGDRWRDVEPALRFGGRGILVGDASADDAKSAVRNDVRHVADLTEAARIVGSAGV